MSNITLVQNNQVFEGFDSYAAVDWCTPSVLGVSACISANAAGGIVTIEITLRSPFGIWSKSFSFDSDTCFSWSPIPKVSIEVCISDFTTGSSDISFTLGGKICVDLFFTKKCIGLSHTFVVPLPAAELATKANTLSDEGFATALLLAAHDDSHCNCK